MKNHLTDLNDHLFAQVERLSDEDMKPEKLETETKRAKAISSLAKDIIGNARLVLDAQIAAKEHGFNPNVVPMLDKKTDV